MYVNIRLQRLLLAWKQDMYFEVKMMVKIVLQVCWPGNRTCTLKLK
jgi:hypothetical protein